MNPCPPECPCHPAPGPEYVPDTGDRTRWVCPGCEPEVDPTLEIVSIRYCHTHEPSHAGADDAAVVFRDCLPSSGSVESGGASNAQWCDVIHRAARAR